MFKEGQYFAPVVEQDDGSLAVHLSDDHPGLHDPEYRRRRDYLATMADRWTPGEPAPEVAYVAEEHDVWRVVCEDLKAKHIAYACQEFLEGKEALDLPVDRVPQLEELSDRIEPLTGFRYQPAAGLVPLRDFYGALADQRSGPRSTSGTTRFPSTRPSPTSSTRWSGTATRWPTRASPRCTRPPGGAARRVETAAALEFVSKVFWFTLEFGVVHEADGLKAYGAGILSSPGEIEEFRGMTIRPLDIAAMGAQDYDITHYQEIFFAARSFTEVEDVVGGFWADCTDDSIARHELTLAEGS